MRRARGRARWGLLAAGALGLVGPGAAQGPPSSLQYAPGHPALMRTADGLLPVRIDQGHLDEMQVELAWLADPTLFAYQLVARANNARLEVHGYVPSQAVREKALAAARAQSRLEVVDSLRTYPSLAARPADQPAESMREAAVAVLAEEFPNQAPGFRVTAHQDGRVTVTGTARSLEEKWKVSCCLRRVRGCTSADNRLALAGIGYPTASQSLPSATAPRTDSVSPIPAVIQTVARERTPPAPPPTPVQRPPAPTVVRNLPPQRSSPVVLPAPTRSPAPVAAASTATPSSAWPAFASSPAETGKSSLAAVPSGLPLYLLPVPDASPAAVLAVQDRGMPAVPAAPRPAIAVPLTAEEQHPPARVASAPAAKPSASSGTVLVKYEESVPHRAPVHAVPKVEKPAAPPVMVRPANRGAPSVTTGAILVADDRPAGRAERSAVVPQPPRAEKAGAGYVTTGAILISEDRPAHRAVAPAGDVTTQIQQRIRAVCGPAARDLLVVRRSASALEVRFVAHSQAEADQLSARMLVLPELLKYQLSFQVRIER